MAITAADINKLRQMTGAGMMDCKKKHWKKPMAILRAAIDFLRKKGQKVAANRADRDAKKKDWLLQKLLRMEKKEC